MKIDWPKPGKYVLAVSGGADSMVLLDLMARASDSKNYNLVVAHFDHGLRDESNTDREFVEHHAQLYGLAFVSIRGKLQNSSEEAARAARHLWLTKMRQDQNAEAVITAHHLNDLIETSLLNLARGSSHRGIAPMQNGPVLRPLLGVTRTELRGYAKSHQIDWREDESNAEISNPRNFVRHNLLPTATQTWTDSYLDLLRETAKLNKEIAQNISTLINKFRQSGGYYILPKTKVQNLSLLELEEILSAIALVLDPDIEIDHRILSELALFIMTAKPHKHRPMRKGLNVVIHSQFAIIRKGN